MTNGHQREVWPPGCQFDDLIGCRSHDKPYSEIIERNVSPPSIDGEKPTRTLIREFFISPTPSRMVSDTHISPASPQMSILLISYDSMI